MMNDQRDAHLPEDVKRVHDLYRVETRGYYDSSFDREFQERLQSIPLLKELAEKIANKPFHEDH